jgi:hypothetical protein
MIAITMGDCAGEFGRRECETLEEACAATRELVAKYPSKFLCFSNPRECDYDHNGLSDDEQEALYVAEIDARRAVGS